MWLPESRALYAHAAIVLVGCQTDTRDHSDTLAILDDERPITADVGRAIASALRVHAFVECSKHNADSMLGATRVLLAAKSSSSSKGGNDDDSDNGNGNDDNNNDSGSKKSQKKKSKRQRKSKTKAIKNDDNNDRKDKESSCAIS